MTNTCSTDGNGAIYFWSTGAQPVAIPVPAGDSSPLSGVYLNDAGVVAAGAPNPTTQTTDLFAWSQSITRLRWVVVKLGLVAAVVLISAATLTVLVIWWRAPLDRAFSGGPWAADQPRL